MFALELWTHESIWSLVQMQSAGPPVRESAGTLFFEGMNRRLHEWMTGMLLLDERRAPLDGVSIPQFISKYMPRFCCAVWEHLLERQDKKQGQEQRKPRILQLCNAIERMIFRRSMARTQIHQRSVSAFISPPAMPGTRAGVSRGIVDRAI